MLRSARTPLFEDLLAVSVEEIGLKLQGHAHIPWAEFVLNPRRLRGSDFLMRWSQGVWSEQRIEQAINQTGKYVAYPYGPSSTAPDGDVRAFELYFERLDAAGLATIKRPDLLIFRKKHQARVDKLIAGVGGISELPFTKENHRNMRDLLELAVVGIECENSLWKARQMPAFGLPMKPMKRLGGAPGFAKSAVLPTIIIKEEDRARLRDWQDQSEVPIHIWHVFFDLAYGIALDRAEELINDGLIEKTEQTFQAPGGATSTKAIYKIYYQYGYPLGQSHQSPTLEAASITDANGHVLPYVKFVGGDLTLDPAVLAELDKLA